MQQPTPGATQTPDLSVVLVTPDTYETIRRTVRYLRAQSARARIELVIVAPSANDLAPDISELGAFGSFRVVEAGAVESVARANAAGVRAAVAPVVVFVEEHSFPQPGWAEAIIAAHRRDWAAVGPVVLNANPSSPVSWADYLIGYGKWLDRKAGAEIDFLPGHNTSYKRDLLLAYGTRLEAMLEAECVLHWDLRARGHRLYLEPAAKVAHLNFSHLSSWVRVHYYNGRVFAAARARPWGPLRRLLFAGGSPLIPVVRLWRILRDLRRAHPPLGIPPLVLPALLLGLILDAVGQMLGYAFGPGQSSRGLAALEFHRLDHVAPRDRAALAQHEASLAPGDP